jgi:pteridine reductase
MTSNPTALITGCRNHNLGGEIAREAARRKYNLLLHYRTEESDILKLAEELRSAGIRVECVAADLSDEGQLAAVFARADEVFTRLDALITCASIWTPKPVLEVTARDLFENFAVNTAATFLCAQEAARRMVRQPEGGAIITFGDWAVARPYREYSAYFTAKGAISTLTASLANELSRLNPRIRVNCVHPGPAMVPDTVSEAERRVICSRTPLRRLGRPENIVQTVFFLLENDYLTGVSIPVDGGRTISNL